MWIQILITIFICFVLLRLFIRFKKGDLKIVEFLLWLFFWLSAGVAVWLPNALTSIANMLGIGRGADLVFYVGLVLIFYLIFKIYLRIEKMERNVTKIVRQNAIEEAENNKQI